MATKNATVSIRNRRCELKLTFEFADHIMHNYMHENSTHPLNFLQIQKAAKSFTYFQKQKRTYIGQGNFNGEKYQVIVILDQQNAVIKTCYKI